MLGVHPKKLRRMLQVYGSNFRNLVQEVRLETGAENGDSHLFPDSNNRVRELVNGGDDRTQAGSYAMRNVAEKTS